MLNVACFVQSCLTDADFVIFSNYCLIGTRLTLSLLSYWFTKSTKKKGFRAFLLRILTFVMLYHCRFSSFS